MPKHSLVEQFAAAIEQAKQQTGFACEGLIDAKVGLVVEGVGPVELPLQPAAARKLAAAATRAPYGSRTETILDPSVRDTLEIAADAVRFSASFQVALDAAARDIAGKLLLDFDRLGVELYKLLIYRKGGFFLPHRDSEKRPGMVATLVVVLPSTFRGGELRVEHQGNQKRYTFDSVRLRSSAEYVAFFADCQHEVKRVESGTRLCLTFNLTLRPKSGRRSQPKSEAHPRLLRAVEDWMQHRPKDPLVFALEHQYTEAGLKPDMLKGGDLELYRQLTALVAEVECEMHFGQVSRHLCQSAYDDAPRHRRGWSRRWAEDEESEFEGDYFDGEVDYDALDIGEVFDDEVAIDGWKDARGRRVSLGTLKCDGSQLISSTPLESWIPTRQDYEGYTGNAGNTLDRWYHKSAIVLWSSREHFDVIAQMGLQHAIERLLNMRKKSAGGNAARRKSIRDDSHALAKAIIGRWPNRLHESRHSVHEPLPWLTDFADGLPGFDDPDLVGEFLRTLAIQDPLLDLDRFVPAAIKRIGIDEILPHLEMLIQYESKPNEYGVRWSDGVARRDASWLCKLCHAAGTGITSTIICHLLDAAIVKLERHTASIANLSYARPGTLQESWVLLCQTAISAEANPQLRRLLDLSAKHPQRFDLRTSQAAAVKILCGWADKHLPERPEPLQDWLASIKRQLQAETNIRPTPPADLRRDGDTDCSCPYCQQLRGFLCNAELPTARIAAREDQREHLVGIIRRKQLDVTTKLDRSTRPYALRLTKTTDSYQRALKRYHDDLELLASLE